MKDDYKLDTASAIGSLDSTRTPDISGENLSSAAALSALLNPKTQVALTKTQHDSTSVTVQSAMPREL